MFYHTARIIASVFCTILVIPAPDLVERKYLVLGVAYLAYV